MREFLLLVMHFAIELPHLNICELRGAKMRVPITWGPRLPSAVTVGLDHLEHLSMTFGF